MIAILTSSLGGYRRVEGKRYPAPLFQENGLVEQIKRFWKENANVLLISASPEEYDRNDSILYIQREAFPMSGLPVNSFEMCDCRTEELIQRLEAYDVLVLAGGHVPTQNQFFKKLDLKRRLENFDGLVISWSAGSMNCAEMVYALPELEGEGVDAGYQRFLPGLGITRHRIIPHFQDVRTDMVDRLRVIEDMAFPDSMGREFIALNDGSFIIHDNGVETLYGEAYRIKDGHMTQICRQGEAVRI
ncbi:MAG: Type 1 glutamine amidotransferase-like domain-containing protein [Acetatifactor sp.]|nr:Type 1 glutamine amidotransferase-like domain-containing protein [Acetatifactor sp.]